MKLFLDEQISPDVAKALRFQGHDALAVAETELGNRKTPDEVVLESAAAQGRLLVTYNIDDFARLATSWAASGRPFPGVLFTTYRRFPGTRPGAMIRRLREFLADWKDREWTPGTCMYL